MLSLTSEVSSSLKEEEEEEQEESDCHGLSHSIERSVFATHAVNVGRKLSCLFQCYEELQDTVNSLLQHQTGSRAEPLREREAS